MDNDGNIDEIKGRAKEAIGAATDNDEIRREGKVDQAKGDVKEKASNAADWAADKINQATNDNR